MTAMPPLKRSKKPEWRDEAGRTRLHRAAAAGAVDAVKALLADDADPDDRDAMGFTAVHLAIQQGGRLVLDALLESGFNSALCDFQTRSSYLHWAVLCGTRPMIPLLAGAGVALDVADAGGFTALGLASQLGKASIAESLLDLGAAIDIGNGDDELSALHLAAATGSAELCRLLLNRGAQAQTPDRTGRSPLELAFGSARAVLRAWLSV
jgi:ankyrin repeat protein